MANRYPLIVDTADNNKIKELPSGDNLNLSGSGIINATSVSVTGTITANAITVNGQGLANVATSGSYNDLLNKPTIITSYNDLTNKPSIPVLTSQLNDVSSTAPSVGQGLVWNGIEYEPGTVSATVDLSLHNIGELQNVVTVGDTTNKFLKYYSGAWRAASVDWTDVQNKPTGVEAQTLGLVGNTLSISDGNSVDLSSITGSPFDQDLNTTDGVEFIGLSLTDGGLNSWNFATTDDGAGGVRLLMEPNGSTYNAIAGNNTPIDLGVSSANDGSGTLQWGSIYTSNTSVLELGLNRFDAGMYQPANVIAELGGNSILVARQYWRSIGQFIPQTPINFTASEMNFNLDGSTPTIQSYWSGGGTLGIGDGTYEYTLHTGNSTYAQTGPSTWQFTFDPGARRDSLGLYPVGDFAFLDNGWETGLDWTPEDLSTLVTSGDSVGNFTLAASVIDTDDSSAITITPAVVMSSDLTIENDLVVNNDLTVTGVLEAQTFSSGGAGTSELISANNLELTAANAVVVTSSPLRMASFTTTQRDALAAQNGDIIYNTTDNKFQGYENGAWVNLV